MKPVPTAEIGGVTDKPDNELRNQRGQANSETQQKAQHSDSDECIDPDLRRLVNVWRLLCKNDRSTLLDHAVRLAELVNQRR